jgi:Kef-type K+ transport system membrane component KefB
MHSKEFGEHRPKNRLLWTGALALLSGLALAIVPFVAQVPGQAALPWLGLLLSALALMLALAGLWRLTREPQRYRAKAASWVLATVSSLLLVFSIFAFHVARQIPLASAAPHVGQRAPEFELKNTNGKVLSLADLLAEPLNPARNSSRPRAVLLVFYRGYW